MRPEPGVQPLCLFLFEQMHSTVAAHFHELETGNSVNVLLTVILLYWKYLHAVKLLEVSKLFYFYMCNVFVNKVQLTFGNEREGISLCLNDDTTVNAAKSGTVWVT